MVLVTAVASPPVETTVTRLAIAVALGLFLGLEREWSQKPAGIRTFALISTLGAIFTIYDSMRYAAGASVAVLVPVGALFVTVLAGFLMYGDGTENGRHLTTAVSLVVAYGVGVLAALGEVLPATAVAVTSSLLLVLKRELHGFAWGLSREEVRSAAEFAILSFVVYPLLPAGTVSVSIGTVPVVVEPRVVWMMVVFVAGIGITNYVVVKTYGSRGIAVTGFFGGLASSTAVVGTMLDHVGERAEAAAYAVAGVLLANAAMALRNLLIAVVFTVGGDTLWRVVPPLAVVVAGSALVAALTTDWGSPVEMDLDNPFSLRNALSFGAMFAVVLVAGGLAQAELGSLGFFATAVLSGLVSSAGATTSAVVLYRTGGLDEHTAVVAVFLATASSIGVKAALAATSSNRTFARRVAAWSAVLLVSAGVVAFFLVR